MPHRTPKLRSLPRKSSWENLTAPTLEFEGVHMTYGTFYPVQEALDSLASDVAWWQYRASHKGHIFESYKKVPKPAKVALDRFNVAKYGPKLRLYRALKSQDNPYKMGGASMSDRHNWGGGHGRRCDYDVDTARDVLVGPDPILAPSKPYGGEREFILKPNARPKLVRCGRGLARR